MDDNYHTTVDHRPVLKEVSTNRQKVNPVNKDVQLRFNKLVTKGKEMTGQGHIAKAVEYYNKAISLVHNDKLARKIKKMEDYLKENEEVSEEEGDMFHVGDGFYLYKDLFSKLYPHQKEGILWFWNLNRKKKGGILGDDMGLGKTIQVISFLSGMFDAEKVHSVLIVMPVSLIMNWEREFENWAPGIRVSAYHGTSKRERERCLAKVQRRGGVCLTSYGMVVSSWELISQQEGREFIWDYVILDEGHKIKNPTKTSKGVHAIAAQNRIILTGTPIQNNLRELWALFDFVHQGMLLGTSRTFKMEYENPITRARERDSTAGEKRLGSEIAESLKRIIAPYFLRRTKGEVQSKTNNRDGETRVDNHPGTPHMPTMSRKNDFIIWVYLSETQQQIYQDFLSLDQIKELLMTNKSPLVALNVLKKICDHPRLLSTHACAQLGLDGEEGMLDTDINDEAVHQAAATRVHEIADETLIKESGKMVFLVELLDNLKAEKHRCLIFSHSRKMLDIIEKVISNRGHKIMRLDGTVTHLYEREQRINKFQADTSYTVFLLTTQVGGVGLTLTAADRVVIFDPSWNPATDAQAVDRAFRIGQDKNVVIYRFITCGSVEEKIYRRQVFKDSLTRQTTGNSKNPFRYFTKQDLRELFTMDNPRHSSTQEQLENMHSHQRKTDTALDGHIAYLHSLEMFGISDHDLMFSQEAEHEPHEADEAVAEDYIQSRVQKAQQLINMESSLQGQGQDPYIPAGSRQPSETNQQKTAPPANVQRFKSPVPSIPNECIDLTVLQDDERETESNMNDTLANLTLEDEEMGHEEPGVEGSPDNPILIRSEPATPAKQAPRTVQEGTPARHVPRTVIEELIISPDAKCPVIQTQRLESPRKSSPGTFHILSEVSKQLVKRDPSSPCVNPDVKKRRSLEQEYASPVNKNLHMTGRFSENSPLSGSISKPMTPSLNLEDSVSMPYDMFVNLAQDRPNSTVMPAPEQHGGIGTPVFISETPDILSTPASPLVGESPTCNHKLANGEDKRKYDEVICDSDEDVIYDSMDEMNQSETINIPDSDEDEPVGQNDLNKSAASMSYATAVDNVEVAAHGDNDAIAVTQNDSIVVESDNADSSSSADSAIQNDDIDESLPVGYEADNMPGSGEDSMSQPDVECLSKSVDVNMSGSGDHSMSRSSVEYMSKSVDVNMSGSGDYSISEPGVESVSKSVDVNMSGSEDCNMSKSGEDDLSKSGANSVFGEDSFHSALGAEAAEPEGAEADKSGSEYSDDGHQQNEEYESEGDYESDQDRDLSDFVVPDDEVDSVSEESGEESDNEDGEGVGQYDGENEGEESDDGMTSKDRKQFKLLKDKARELYKEKDLRNALWHALKALEIFPEKSLQISAIKMKMKLDQQKS